MKKSLDNFAHWICRQLTPDDFSSLMVILMEVLSGSTKNFDFKPEPKTENYRRFRVDELPPLNTPPEKVIVPEFDWRQVKADYELKNGSSALCEKLAQPSHRKRKS